MQNIEETESGTIVSENKPTAGTENGEEPSSLQPRQTGLILDQATGMTSSENELNSRPQSSPGMKKQVDKFSLESCLEQFTSLELLTGGDRFCCEFCTHQQVQKKDTPKSQPSSNGHISSDKNFKEKLPEDETPYSKDACNKSDEESDDKSESHLSAVEERDDEVNPLERSSSSTSSSISCKEDDEDTEMLESTKESDGMCIVFGMYSTTCTCCETVCYF